MACFLQVLNEFTERTIHYPYANSDNTALAYRIGLGADVDLTPHTRLGLAYRYAGLGHVGLGTASFQNVNMPGTLSQSNFNVNEVLAQLTYII